MGVAEWWARYMARLEATTRPRPGDGAPPASPDGHPSPETAWDGQRLRELNVLALVLHSTGTIDEMISALVQKGPEVTDAMAVYPLLLDKRRDVLHGRHLEGVDDPHLDRLNAAFDMDLSEVEYPLPVSHPRRVALDTGDVASLETLRDFAEDVVGRKACDAAGKKLGLRRLALVPMVLDGDPLGLLVFFFEKEQFDQQVLELLAGHATLALKGLMELEEVGRFGHVDQMTWLANRRGFLEALEREVTRSRRYKRPISCIFIDIDNFALFNVNYGPSLGDRLLRSVGMLLADAVREPELVARFGGDEFAILLPETNRAAAVATTTAIMSKLAQVTVFGGEGGPEAVTASVVIVCYPDDGATARELVASASAGLEEAKRDKQVSARHEAEKVPQPART